MLGLQIVILQFNWGFQIKSLTSEHCFGLSTAIHALLVLNYFPRTIKKMSQLCSSKEGHVGTLLSLHLSAVIVFHKFPIVTWNFFTSVLQPVELAVCYGNNNNNFDRTQIGAVILIRSINRKIRRHKINPHLFFTLFTTRKLIRKNGYRTRWL